MPAARSNKPNNALPTNPDLRTRLFLRQLERRGVDSVQKLSASDWEIIHRLEAAAAVAGTGALVVNGRVR